MGLGSDSEAVGWVLAAGDRRTSRGVCGENPTVRRGCWVNGGVVGGTSPPPNLPRSGGGTVCGADGVVRHSVGPTDLGGRKHFDFSVQAVT